MLKAGIYLDLENIVRCGGWGIRLKTVRELVEAQGMTIVRANAYMAIDREREQYDFEYKKKKMDYREAVRNAGFHLVLKEVKRYTTAEGETLIKANSDMDLAIDAVMESQNLDYILLGSGDGDFVRLVTNLQNRGRRVDLLSFANSSAELRRSVDVNFNGFLVPGILPTRNNDEERYRGVLHVVNEEKGFGFITIREGLALNDVRDDIFCHITDFEHLEDRPVTNKSFSNLRVRQTVLEFDLEEQEDGKLKAINVTELDTLSRNN